MITIERMHNKFSNAKSYLASLQSIEKSISKNHLPEAASQLNLLVKNNPSDPRLFLLGARLAERANNPKGTLAAAQKAHELAPLWPVSSFFLATVMAEQGQADEAVSMTGLAVEQAAAQSATVDAKVAALINAADLAHRIGQHSRALQWLRQAEIINPENQQVAYKIGLTLTDIGKPADSIAVFSKLLQQQPEQPAFLMARLLANVHARQMPQAVSDGKAILANDATNEQALYYLSVALGETPRTIPGSVIAGWFDQFALQPTRSKKLASDVALMIHQWHPDGKGDVLELGCGTGELGRCLGSIEGVLVGVDLSGAMIERAAKHHVYDRFHQVNLLDALHATPPSLYHVIAALDVFAYLGELDSVIENVHRILLPAGRFVFSFEPLIEGEADYALQHPLQYVHQVQYVQRLLKRVGFSDITLEQRVISDAATEPVYAYFGTASKVLSTNKKPQARRKKVSSSTIP